MKNSFSLTEDNIVFTARPWAWKTSIWKRLANDTWYNFIDFDDDILEKITEDTAIQAIEILELTNKKPKQLIEQEVRHLIDILWINNFSRLEWFIWKNLNLIWKNILSTSGSLPLRLDAMQYLKQKWKVIYIDENMDRIIHRLKLMKDDRIIWMEKWKTLKEVLIDRDPYYKATRDIVFKVPDQKLVDVNNKKEVEKNIDFVYETFKLFLEQNNLYQPIWNIW